jgi:23S rRNA (uracil1939-C5)-methyltransferase
VTLAAGDDEYGFDARTFFQGHRGLLDDLIGSVVAEKSGEVAFDLYAGVGLFSLPLARRYRKVVAVEGDRIAARYLRKNAQRARLDIEVQAKSVEAAIREVPIGIDRVVVDPPRAGLGYRVRSDLFDRRPRHLTYVSCHPAVLARDLKHLCRIYQLEQVTYLDLFPQTGHIELVAQLRLDERAQE